MTEPAKHRPRWLRRAWFIVAHILVPSGLSGGLNFLVAWLLYARKLEDTPNVWFLPGTLAGDLAVTIFVQVGLTYVLDAVAVHGDVKNGFLPALEPPTWVRSGPPRTLFRTFGRMTLFFIDIPRRSTLALPRFLFAAVLRAVLFGAVVFVPFWGASVGILYALPRKGYFQSPVSPAFDNWPLPSIVKGVFGTVLAALTTPWMAWMSMIRCWLWREEERRHDDGANGLANNADDRPKVFGDGRHAPID